jgi:hypothetical protein
MLPRHWELDVNKCDGQFHVHWWKDIETIKIKKILKAPFPHKEKTLSFLIHVIGPHWQSKTSFPNNISHPFLPRLNASHFD